MTLVIENFSNFTLPPNRLRRYREFVCNPLATRK